MTAPQTEYDHIKFFRSMLLFNPNVDSALDPALNTSIDPQLNKNKSELDKANFIRCLIIVAIIEKYRDKARNSLQYEKQKEFEIDNFLLKRSAFRHMLQELEDEDDEMIAKKIKELAYKKAHAKDPGFFDEQLIQKLTSSLQDFAKAARKSRPRPHL